MKQEWEPAQLEEMPVVILSLHQKWWQKMAAGEKVLELRKSKPQCKTSFRVLVYITGGVGIVGEFICPEVLEVKNFEEAEKKAGCLHMIFTITQRAAGAKCTAGK